MQRCVGRDEPGEEFATYAKVSARPHEICTEISEGFDDDGVLIDTGQLLCTRPSPVPQPKTNTAITSRIKTVPIAAHWRFALTFFRLIVSMFFEPFFRLAWDFAAMCHPTHLCGLAFPAYTGFWLNIVGVMSATLM